MKKLLVVVLSVVLSLVLAYGVVKAASPDSPLAEYPVPGNPGYVTVEAPGRVWFTLPEQNMIGRLVMTSTTDYQVLTYTTTLTEPYDLAYASGKVWFTGRSANAVGRLDPSDGSIASFPLPTQNSRPGRIDVLLGSPATLWFAEEGVNALARLVVTSTVDYHVAEYPLPASLFGSDADIHGVDIQNSDSIWFTAPGAGSIGRFKPSEWLWDQAGAFARVATGAGSAPMAIELDSHGYPWFTEAAGNRIGKFFPQTISTFEWHQIPDPNAGLYDLVAGQGYIWFTEYDSGKLGRLNPPRQQVQEFGVPGSGPRGLDIDASGTVWVADDLRARILEWRSPYFYSVYLPCVMRQF